MAESEKDQRLPHEALPEDVLRIRQRGDRAQVRAQRYVKSGVCLVNELIRQRARKLSGR